ncbi:MAG: DUF2911 domain-containing protein [Bacteroidia bacterium]|nr:DUF2911 domain-containing protein [Bacteroidia bacterium]
MKKKILIGLGAFILLVAGVLFYMISTTKKHSPNQIITYTENGFDIEINYCRPYKKGRVIFGPTETGALQTYGQYWRLGANEATTFTTKTDLLINGSQLPAGKYAIYAIPNQGEWAIAFNTENSRWGATPPDEINDVIRVNIPAEETNNISEQFTINFLSADSALQVKFAWDNVILQLPIEQQEH